MSDGRMGLVGALPVGDRWRAQGYIDGKHRYLGTFDTEEDAHRVFLRSKEDAEKARQAEAEAEVERILSGPTYVYRGGVGRGAALNGHRFKVVEHRDPHAAVVVPVLSDGTLGWDAQRTVLRAYLEEDTQEPLPIPEATPRAASAAITIDQGARPTLKADLQRFVGRPLHHDLAWAIEFIERHGRPKASAVVGVLTGTAGVQRQLAWLRANTAVPPDLIDEIERETIASLFASPETAAAARVLGREFPERDRPPEAGSDIVFEEEQD